MSEARKKMSAAWKTEGASPSGPNHHSPITTHPQGTQHGDPPKETSP